MQSDSPHWLRKFHIAGRQYMKLNGPRKEQIQDRINGGQASIPLFLLAAWKGCPCCYSHTHYERKMEVWLFLAKLYLVFSLKHFLFLCNFPLLCTRKCSLPKPTHLKQTMFPAVFHKHEWCVDVKASIFTTGSLSVECGLDFGYGFQLLSKSNLLPNNAWSKA